MSRVPCTRWPGNNSDIFLKKKKQNNNNNKKKNGNETHRVASARPLNFQLVSCPARVSPRERVGSGDETNFPVRGTWGALIRNIRSASTVP